MLRVKEWSPVFIYLSTVSVYLTSTCTVLTQLHVQYRDGNTYSAQVFLRLLLCYSDTTQWLRNATVHFCTVVHSAQFISYIPVSSLFLVSEHFLLYSYGYLEIAQCKLFNVLKLLFCS